MDIDSNAENPDGLSWATAFPSIQQGIDAAYEEIPDPREHYKERYIVHTPYDYCEVWVAEGRYEVHRGNDDDTIAVMPGIHLYGGFAGNEKSLEQRDLEKHQTRIDAQSASGGRPKHLMTYEEDRKRRRGIQSSVIDGFTFIDTIDLERWHWTEIKQPTIAIYDKNGIGLTISNCRFMGLVGTCVRIHTGYIRSCEFIGNYHPEKYKTIQASGALFLLVQGCKFEENLSEIGVGGIGAEGIRVVVRDCLFKENKGLYPGWGSAMVNACNARVERCTFIRNQGMGVGIFESISKLAVESSLFIGNRGIPAGAAYAGKDTALRITNSVLYGNIGLEAGVAYEEVGEEPWSGIKIVNSIIYGNKIWKREECGSPPLEETPTADGPALLQEDPRELGGPPINVMYSLVQGGYQGPGNIDADPGFRDPRAMDFRLKKGSPCIDAGIGHLAPLTDFVGRQRQVAPGSGQRGAGPPWVDMGAYEYIP